MGREDRSGRRHLLGDKGCATKEDAEDNGGRGEVGQGRAEISSSVCLARLSSAVCVSSAGSTIVSHRVVTMSHEVGSSRHRQGKFVADGRLACCLSQAGVVRRQSSPEPFCHSLQGH